MGENPPQVSGWKLKNTFETTTFFILNLDFKKNLKEPAKKWHLTAKFHEVVFRKVSYILGGWSQIVSGS